ncbi:hypothetical protein BFP78_01945 [Gaetbulibacter sp. 5U11]|nr:hypothetical protein BFP78_01945 [Gaetbulibacter sp. 5U11]
MKALNLSQLEKIEAGGSEAVSGFCSGFATFIGVYSLGIATQLWNPIGWFGSAAGIATGAVIGIGCTVNGYV